MPAQKHLTPFVDLTGPSRAANKAVKAEKRSSNVLEIKDEHGIIKDIFRNQSHGTVVFGVVVTTTENENYRPFPYVGARTRTTA